MTGSNATAVVAVCWNDGGQHLIGLVVVRRPDAKCFFIDLPPDWMARLATLDRQFVATQAPQLLALAKIALSRSLFREDEVISRQFLAAGSCPARPGSMRHVPAELVALAGGGEGWRLAGFIVDVGEVTIDPEREMTLLH